MELEELGFDLVCDVNEEAEKVIQCFEHWEEMEQVTGAKLVMRFKTKDNTCKEDELRQWVSEKFQYEGTLNSQRLKRDTNDVWLAVFMFEHEPPQKTYGRYKNGLVTTTGAGVQYINTDYTWQTVELADSYRNIHRAFLKWALNPGASTNLTDFQLYDHWRSYDVYNLREENGPEWRAAIKL
eukprot:TRINITY_DN66668_c4_g6_i1.p1 TRINITY_DN66668_c4_g6~~TRINITY_DN66668_c4_g6_i1.p1  ORF type:complete len:182 (+),score=17.48 TRINITY_DN66668_c4_g6_i1:180-725(+)